VVASHRPIGQRLVVRFVGEPAVERAAACGAGRVERPGDDRPAAEPATQRPAADRPVPVEHPGTDNATVEPTDICSHFTAGPTSGKHDPTCLWQPNSVTGGLFVSTS
jgi:hypothetical protein